MPSWSVALTLVFILIGRIFFVDVHGVLAYEDKTDVRYILWK